MSDDELDKAMNAAVQRYLSVPPLKRGSRHSDGTPTAYDKLMFELVDIAKGYKDGVMPTRPAAWGMERAG